MEIEEFREYPQQCYFMQVENHVLNLNGRQII